MKMIETYEYDIAEKALGDFNSRVDAFLPTRKKGMVILDILVGCWMIISEHFDFH